MSLVEKYPDLSSAIKSLSDTNKVVRKKSLMNLEKQLLEHEKDLMTEDNEFLEKDIFGRIVGLLRDEHERIREISASLLLKIFNLFGEKLLDVFFSKIIEIVNSKIVEVDSSEPSEEVRLEMMKLIAAILFKHVNQTKYHKKDMWEIIENGVDDKYHEVKQLSCDCLVMMSISEGAFIRQNNL